MTDYTIKFTDATKSTFVIKPYTTNGPLNPSSSLPLHPLAVSAGSSLVLIGKGVVDYGAIIQNNVIYLTENFANSTAPAYPLEGQHWYNNSTNQLMSYDGTSWRQVVINGIMNTSLNVNAQRVENVSDPVNPQDAATKKYVDDTFVERAGSTMTGYLTLNADPVNGLHAVTKQYVDTSISSIGLENLAPMVQYVDDGLATKLNVAGGTLTGPTTVSNADFTVSNGNIYIQDGSLILSGASATVDAGGAVISNAADPVNGTDVATKQYVDNHSGGSGGGAVTGGNVDPDTGVVSITLSDAFEVILTGAAAASNHTHGDQTITHSLTESIPSILKESLLSYNALSFGGYEDVLERAVNVLDEYVHKMLYRNRRHILSGTGSATITLPFKYPVEMDKLSVYKNGIKQYRNARAHSVISNTSGVTTLATGTALTADTYNINVNIDGTLHTDVPIDLTLASEPIRYSAIVDALRNALATSGYQTISFATPLVDGTEVTGLASGTSYAATINVDGNAYTLHLVDGSDANTIGDLIAALQALLVATRVASSVDIVGGKLQIVSNHVGVNSSISIVDAVGPDPAPLFSSLTNFSAIDAAIAGTSIATVRFIDGAIHTISPTAGVGSQVTISAPSSGTDLISSMVGASVTNQTITSTYDYTEDGAPVENSNSVTFPAVTSGSDVYEFIVEPYFVP